MTTRVPNYFVDPLSGTTYAWTLNHEEEEEFGRNRNIEHTANTGNVGLIRQEGDREPFVLKLSGKILEKSQLDFFWGFFALCDTQTIHFQDFTGARYEVQITDFQPKRLRAAKNSRDPANAPLWYWSYTMTMEVFSFVSGPTPLWQLA